MLASTRPNNDALFTTIDVEGVPRTVQAVLTGLSTPLTVTCSGQVQPDRRNTIVLTQTVTGEFVPAPTCVAADQVCTQIAEEQKQAGRVTIQCAIFNENLNSIEDSCTTDPVNIWREDPLADPQFIFRTEDADDNLDLEDGERVLIGEQLASSPTGATPDIRNLNQNIDYQIRNEAVFADAPARRHDFFWGPGFFITQSLKTGRVAVLNAAYRTNAAGTALDNTFDFQIAQNGIAFHAQFDLIAGQKTNFIELPVGVYQFSVFVGADIVSLFGQRANSIAKSAVAIATGSITIAADQHSVVVLQGGVADISAGAPSITQVDISDAANGVDRRTTEFEVFNLVQGVPLVFADPEDDCCNFINGRQAIQPGTSGSRTFNSGSLPSTSFNAYESGATCPALASSLIEADALSLTRTANGNNCERKAVFLIGRAGEVAVPVSGVGVCNECSNSQTVVKTLNTVGPINSQGSQIQQVEFNVPLCECDDDDDFVDPCDVCLADEFTAIDNRISALSSQLTRDTNAIDAAVEDVNDDVDRVRKDVGNVEKDVQDVESAIGDLSSNQGDIESAVDDVESAVKDVRSRLG